MDDFGDSTGTDGSSTFPDGEFGPLFKSDRVDELDGEGHVVTRHNHLDVGRKSDIPGDVGGPEEELRPIAI